MLRHCHNAIHPEKLRQILLIIRLVGDEVKVILAEHQRHRLDLPLDVFPVHLVIRDGHQALFVDHLDQVPQIIDESIAVRFHLVVVIDFLAYQLFELFPILDGRKPFQLGNHAQHVLFRKAAAAQHHFYQCEQLLVFQELVTAEVIRLILIGIDQFRLLHQISVIREELLYLCNISAHAFGGHTIFFGNCLDGNRLSTQHPKKEFQHPAVFF